MRRPSSSASSSAAAIATRKAGASRSAQNDCVGASDASGRVSTIAPNAAMLPSGSGRKSCVRNTPLTTASDLTPPGGVSSKLSCCPRSSFAQSSFSVGQVATLPPGYGCA